jgi:hypothetical protein
MGVEDMAPGCRRKPQASRSGASVGMAARCSCADVNQRAELARAATDAGDAVARAR